MIGRGHICLFCLKRKRFMNYILEAKNLSKDYKRIIKGNGLREKIVSLFKKDYEIKNAISNFSVNIKKGEFIGLIGPNGAGKTTLIKMFSGIITPTNGELEVLGFQPYNLINEFKKKYSIIMGQKSQLFLELTVNDVLELHKEIYEIEKTRFMQNKEYLSKLFGVEKLLTAQVRTLSLGERMKMELIVALIHEPEIVFLDEPTIGLDAIASMEVRNLLKKINEEKGVTIILTSHYLEDIRQLCNRTIVINNGACIYDGDTGLLFEKYQTYKQILIKFKENTMLDDDLDLIYDSPCEKKIKVKKDNIAETLQLLMKYNPYDIEIIEEDIGYIAKRIYEGEVNDEKIC